MPQRLNKYIATNLGISRREADDLISAGQVFINGHPAVLGARVEESAKVLVKGKTVQPTTMVCLTLNKPPGYVSSRRAQSTTPTLYELLPPEFQTLKTVGRLDKDSSGLILLTNNGDFAFTMTHPKFHKTKIYTVTLDHPLEPLHQQTISDSGVTLTDGSSKFTLTSLDASRKNWQVQLTEGRNRQIRRTFGALGYTVTKLHRTNFGNYALGDLKSGEWSEIEVRT